jgi:hypothetical protein
MKTNHLQFTCDYPANQFSDVMTRYSCNVFPCEDYDDNADPFAIAWLLVVEIHNRETIRETYDTWEGAQKAYLERVNSFFNSCSTIGE